MDVDRSTPEALAFRRVYQLVADRTAPARELEELTSSTLGPPPRSPRRAWPAAVAAAALVLALVGVSTLALRGDGQPMGEQAGPTSPFVVMADPAGVLGPDARITAKSESSDAFADGGAEMQMWARESETGLEQAVAVVTGASDDYLSEVADFAGPSETIERNGVTLTRFLPDPQSGSETTEVQWQGGAGSTSLLIARGLSDDAVLEIAVAVALDGTAAGAVPDGLEPVYDGDQMLAPPAGVILREVVYGAAAGYVDLFSFEGWAPDQVGFLLRSGEARRVDVNGRPGVLTPTGGSDWAVVWTDGNDLTFAVESGDVSTEELLAAARSVRSITEAEWDALVADPGDASGGSAAPSSDPID